MTEQSDSATQWERLTTDSRGQMMDGAPVGWIFVAVVFLIVMYVAWLMVGVA